MKNILFLCLLIAVILTAECRMRNMGMGKNVKNHHGGHGMMMKQDRWADLTGYKYGNASDCNDMCHKHETCLLETGTDKGICVKKMHIKMGRRMFDKFHKQKVAEEKAQKLASDASATQKHHQADTSPKTSNKVLPNSIIPKVEVKVAYLPQVDGKESESQNSTVKMTDESINRLKTQLTDISMKNEQKKKQEVEFENHKIQEAVQRRLYRKHHKVNQHNKHGGNHVHKAAIQNMDQAPDSHVCSKKGLSAIRDRLNEWFALVHEQDAENGQADKVLKLHKHKCSCQETAVWMLHKLDINDDNSLNHSELKGLETTPNEPCLKPLIRSCDHDNDKVLSRKEWCCCFAEFVPPCIEDLRSRVNHGFIGIYVPQCDIYGYYEKEQCHGSTGHCWCVDFNGNEITNTRVRGSANCDAFDAMGHRKN